MAKKNSKVTLYLNVGMLVSALVAIICMSFTFLKSKVTGNLNISGWELMTKEGSIGGAMYWLVLIFAVALLVFAIVGTSTIFTVSSKIGDVDFYKATHTMGAGAICVLIFSIIAALIGLFSFISAVVLKKK